jgi:hypothetical protein
MEKNHLGVRGLPCCSVKKEVIIANISWEKRYFLNQYPAFGKEKDMM